MSEKQCTGCLIVRKVEEFSKSSNSKDGLRHKCKICRKNEYQKNKKQELSKMREYKINNSEKIKEMNKNYQKNYSKQYKAYQKQWRRNNKPKINSHTRYRKKNDPLYKLRCNLAGTIYAGMKRRGYSKKSKTHELLGADFEIVQKHLIESAIKNYGFYDPNFTYHIDHIKPCVSAKNEEELIKLQHYTNLQYLTPEDNLRKNDKELEVWLKEKELKND